MEAKTAKYAFWGTILAASITGGIGLYIHLDGKSTQIIPLEQKKIAEEKKDTKQSNTTASLTISNVYVPPVNTSLDSAFFAKIENNSLNTAKEVSVKINFGKASISSCETLPKNAFTENQKFETSVVSFKLGDLQIKDEVYVYCLLSHPAFESILITGPNLYSNTEYTYKDFEYNNNQMASEKESGFVDFFKVIATIVALIFIGYFTIVIIAYLNKKISMYLK